MNFRKIFISFNIILLVGLVLARSCNSVDNRYKGYSHPYFKKKQRRSFPNPVSNRKTIAPEIIKTYSNIKKENPKTLKPLIMENVRLCSPQLYENCVACYDNCSVENSLISDLNYKYLKTKKKYNDNNPTIVYKNLLLLKEEIAKQYNNDIDTLNSFDEEINHDSQIQCYTSEHLCDINKEIYELSKNDEEELAKSYELYYAIDDNEHNKTEEEIMIEGQKLASQERMEANNQLNNEIQISNNYTQINKFKRDIFINNMLNFKDETLEEENNN